MASGGRVDRGSRPRGRPIGVVVPFPRRRPGEGLDLGRVVPSGRSLLLAFALLAGALLAWLGARESGVFAVQTLEVRGASPGVSVQVRRALADSIGPSLLKVDLDAAQRVVEALPTVQAARFDRAFPHTLRISVEPEHAGALVRQGAASYLLSVRGRVVATADRHDRPKLPRIWVKKNVELRTGAIVDGDLLTAVRAVAPLAGARFPARVISVTVTPDALTLVLRSGVELRLGDPADVALKLEVARRVLPLLGDGTTYLDVAVPERPVAG